jgi:hypothetical protein
LSAEYPKPLNAKHDFVGSMVTTALTNRVNEWCLMVGRDSPNDPATPIAPTTTTTTTTSTKHKAKKRVK